VQRTRLAVDKRCPDPNLKALDPPAERRLRRIAPFGRARETAEFRDCQKVL
jgi:hypothetical protein